MAHMCGPSCWWTDGGEWEVGLERCTERREESHNIHACNINVSLYLHMHARTKWAGFPRGFKWCVMRLGAVITHTDFSKTNTPSQEKKLMTLILLWKEDIFVEGWLMRDEFWVSKFSCNAAYVFLFSDEWTLHWFFRHLEGCTDD